MPFRLVFLCQLIAFSLNRFDVQDFGTWNVF
jgi:hypothetical protein